MTSTTSDGNTTYTITQTAQQAYLEWAQFDLAYGDTLNFDQSAGGSNVTNWIVFNYIRDASGNPSKIYGSINAAGQVYILNANGIIFGGTAQVNTHALVASALPINPNLIQRGLLVQNAGDVQFLFSGVDSYSAVDGVAPEQSAYRTVKTIDNGDGTTTAVKGYGDITVYDGAQLTATDDIANHTGGRIALIGANVTNSGTITTNDGQTILAAGLQVGFVAHSSSDATLRGLDVFVGKVADANGVEYAGTVTNNGTVVNGALADGTGLIEADRGSVYITGKTVNQNGVIASTTSVSYNGRIDLVAGYNAVDNSTLYDPSGSNSYQLIQFYYSSASDNSGTVELGPYSVTQILPEIKNATTVTGDLVLPSLINIEAKAVRLNTGSIVVAPGATAPTTTAYGADGLALTAGVTVHAGRWYGAASASGLTTQFVFTDDDQQIYLDSNATIDAAGLTWEDIVALGGVLPSVAEFFIDVELRGTELANYPVQRNGALRGTTVTVDIRQHGTWDSSTNSYTWIGTPLADLAAWVALVEHTVAELSINGGSVSMKAGGSIVVNAGATVDVSGGSMKYTSAVVKTTKVIADGKIYDISAASADVAYDGIYTGSSTETDSKWGAAKTTTNSLQTATTHLESGYTQGGNGGSITISGSALALDGTLTGTTSAGTWQTSLSPIYSTTSPTTLGASNLPLWLLNAVSLPISSTLSLSIGREYEYTDSSNTTTFESYSPTPAKIVITGNSTLTALSTANSAFAASGEYSVFDARAYEIDLSPTLFDNDKGSGFGIVQITNNDDNFGGAAAATKAPAYGSITIASGTTVSLAAGGALMLSSANITVEHDASVTAPGGLLSLSAYDISPSYAAYIHQNSPVSDADLPTYDRDRGKVSIGENVTLSTAGEVVDYRTDASASARPLVTKGGTITLAGNAISLGSGSTVDVSGGAKVSLAGKFAYGNAGKIIINSSLALGSDLGSVVGGRLELDGSLLGYTGVGGTGGTLQIQAAGFEIEQTLASGALLETDATNGTLLLSSAFFNTGGFSTYSFTGLGTSIGADGQWTGASQAVVIGTPTIAATIHPQVANWLALPGGEVWTAEEGVRSTASLTFAAKGQLSDANGLLFADESGSPLNDSSIILNAGSSVLLDPGTSASVALSAGTTGTIEILGKISAPGGTISIKQTNYNYGLPDIYLGPNSVLSVAGATVYGDSSFLGHYASTVLSGGKVSVDGNIVAEAGATIDASGASDTIEVLAGSSANSGVSNGMSSYVPVVKDSDGGAISLTGEEMLFFAGTLLGKAGVERDGATTGVAGSLTVTSNLSAVLSKVSSTVIDAEDPVMIVTSAAPDFSFTNFGKKVVDSTGAEIGDSGGFGKLFFYAGKSNYDSSQFGSLTLAVTTGAIEVSGDVSLTASRQISVANGGVLSFENGSSLALTASYVDLGTAFSLPGVTTTLSATPTSGSGSLSVAASTLIDVGSLVVKGASKISLDATNNGQTSGAIRGDGTLAVAGEIDLAAGQIYPPTETTFTIMAVTNTVTGDGGVVRITNNGVATPSTPLSAGGKLDIYASEIDQGGVLRAPLGEIVLGNTSTTATEAVTSISLPVTLSVTFESGSLTSVAADGLTIPYGINVNGDTWVDPSGTDITTTSLTATSKEVIVAGEKIVVDGADDTAGKSAATIDLSGGGDIEAYRFVTGTGGTKDILSASTSSFAIIPTSYADMYAPYAAYNSNSSSGLLSADSGYVSSYTLGSRIYLSGGGGIAAGWYTILPARYALLDGAYLVTQKSTTATAGARTVVAQTDGSYLISGYIGSGLDSAGQSQSLYTTFEVASKSVVEARAQYDLSTGNSFFTSIASTNSTTTPRLPIDAGQLVFNAQSALTLEGSILANYASGGRASIVDITTSSANIQIGGSVSGSDALTTLLIDPAQLNDLGSVLIGGTRTTGTDTTSISVSVGNLTVAKGTVIKDLDDLILVASGSLVIDDGVSISSKIDDAYSAEALALSGNGALVRVSGDKTASSARSGGSTGTLTVGSNSGAATSLVGDSIILDSALNASIASNVVLGGSGSWVTLSGSKIRIQSSTDTAVTDGLSLKGDLLNALNDVAMLSLSSYSSIVFDADVTLGSSSLSKLELHAASVESSGGSDTIQAGEILLDNEKSASATFSGTVAGTLLVNATTIDLGGGALTINGFSDVTLAASREVLIGGTSTTTGTFSVASGNLSVQTPVVLSAATASRTVSSSNTLTIEGYQGMASTDAASTPTLAGKLTLTGQSVAIGLGAKIELPSGTFAAQASGPAGVSVAGTVDVGGVTKSFYDVTKSADGGTITLTATTGNVDVSGGSLNVGRFAGDTSTSNWTGNAGTISLAAPMGLLVTNSSTTINGQAENSGGLGGNFELDVSRLTTSGDNSLAALHALLGSGGFDNSIDLRIRNGNVVVDSSIRAHDYTLSADGGSITVAAGVTIDASGLEKGNLTSSLSAVDLSDVAALSSDVLARVTGGTITLAARDDVSLESGSWLNAAGYAYDNAGKGGTITLSAGTYGSQAVNNAAVVSLASGAKIDLGVRNDFSIEDMVLYNSALPSVTTLSYLAGGGTLYLRESWAALANNPTQFDNLAKRVGTDLNGAASVIIEGNKVYDLSENGLANNSIDQTLQYLPTGGLIDLSVEYAVKNDGTTFASDLSSSILSSKPTVSGTTFDLEPSAEIVNSTTPNSMTVTSKLVTLTASNANLQVILAKGTASSATTTAVSLPGGIPIGDTLTLAGLSTTSKCTVTYYDMATGTSSSKDYTSNQTLSSTTSQQIVSIKFTNTKTTGTNTVTITFKSGTSPVTLALNAGLSVNPSTTPTTTYAKTSSTTVPVVSTYAGDITLASTWDLATDRANENPGVLTLRSQGNLVFNYDASLSDGFDATNNALASTYSLWTAYLMSGRSWSYRLVAGADYGAADNRTVDAGAGSVQVGKGSPAYSSTSTSRSTIIPQWYQTIRTGTGDIDIYAGYDVQLLNPLATIYTAGSLAGSVNNFDAPDLQEDGYSNYTPYYTAQYSLNGGNVIIKAGHNIIRGILDTTTGVLTDTSSYEMPTNWLYRRGTVAADGTFSTIDGASTSEVQSTSWWVDFSNFFDDVGTLGGGNLTLVAGNDVKNVNASVATNARVTKQTTSGDTLAADQILYELGGGNLTIKAGNNINGGVYYAERGDIMLNAGNDVTTNSTRYAYSTTVTGATDPLAWLPTTLFIGKGSVDVEAGADALVGAITNPFWYYQSANNTTYEVSYFSTMDATDTVDINSLSGAITLRASPGTTLGASLLTWYTNKFGTTKKAAAYYQPWLRLEGTESVTSISSTGLADLESIMPSTLRVVAFDGSINLVGTINLSPSPTGSLDLLAADNVNGMAENGINNNGLTTGIYQWESASINLSDASPESLPGIYTPLTPTESSTSFNSTSCIKAIDAIFDESGSTTLSLAERLALHGSIKGENNKAVALHYYDNEPVHLYTANGDISGLTLFSAKSAKVVAGQDITDIALYIQNVHSTDVTLVAAARDVVLYDPNSALRVYAQKNGTLSFTSGVTGVASGSANAGDVQVAGSGSLEILAGRNLELGSGSKTTSDGTAAGVTTIGVILNPYLDASSGASITAMAGMGTIYTTSAAANFVTPGLASMGLNYGAFIKEFLDPSQEGNNASEYLLVLGELMGLSTTDTGAIWAAFGYDSTRPLSEKQASWVLGTFLSVLRDAGRDHNDATSPYVGTYARGYAAIEELYGTGTTTTTGNITLSRRLIKTVEGGAIELFAPTGGVTVGLSSDPQSADQGILTQHGGNIGIFAEGDVMVGNSRIFTLRGGNEIVWSSEGSIAAGSGAKTVAAAPPTRVLIDPQSADVQNDLAGLATGSGIGVLATLAGVVPGDVDLVAPAGTIDAGDAGIRSSGHVNVSAAVIVNAANIQSSAGTSGTPVVATTNVGGITSAVSTTAGATSSVTDATKQQQRAAAQTREDVLPSIIQVEVLGYGGGEGDDQLSTANKISDQD